MSDWIRHALWWQVYPLGFTGAEPTALPAGAPAIPRLRRLEAWLPHLLDACAATGVRVLLDGVFHHVGRGHPRFQDVLRSGPGHPSAAWFHVQQDAAAPDGFRYDDFEGHPSLVRLNHDEPAVAEHVTRVMSTWCDRGVAAWRLDAAYAVPPPAFWRRVLPAVRQRHPDVWVVGEVIHGDYARYVEESGLDSVTQYELWKAIWSSLNDGNLFELAHALRRHDAMTRRFLPQTFVGNHDVTRIASRLHDRRHLDLAVALLCVLPGVPTLWSGDEWALEGVKEDRAGGDDAVRAAFPAAPGDAAEPRDPARAAVADLHRALIGGEQLAVVLNLADSPAEVALPLPGGRRARRPGHGPATGRRGGRHRRTARLPSGRPLSPGTPTDLTRPAQPVPSRGAQGGHVVDRTTRPQEAPMEQRTGGDRPPRERPGSHAWVRLAPPADVPSPVAEPVPAARPPSGATSSTGGR